MEPLKELEHPTLEAIPQKHEFDESHVVEKVNMVSEYAHEGSPPFFIDTHGDQSLASNKGQICHIPSPRERPPSASSESSDDVILFRGRKGTHQTGSSSAAVDEVKIGLQSVETNVQQLSLERKSTDRQRGTSPSSPKPWMLRGHQDEDDLVADYLANMADEDEDSNEDAAASRNPFSITRDLGGSDGVSMPVVQSNDDASSAADTDDEDNSIVVDGVQDSTSMELQEIDDATLARLLSKQEELGIGADDLALYSEDVFTNPKPSGNNSANRKVPGSFRSTRNARRGILSASAVADAFDELDLMDWDPFNPPRKPKSKRGQPTFDISDSELEATMQATFQKDRLQKKERKREREELRAQGLLGKNVDPEDMRVRYPTGMTMDQIKEEMRLFLQGTEQL